MRLHLKGINKITRKRKDGSTVIYYYHRQSGQRIHGEPGTAEFIANYTALSKSRGSGDKGTIAELVRRFAGSLSDKIQPQYPPSPEFSDMADTTKAEYRRKLRIVNNKWGNVPFRPAQAKGFRRDVLAWRDKIAVRARREADNLVSALARILAFGVERGDLDTNILASFRRVYRSNRADMIWLPEHVEAFLKVASVEMTRAFMLAMHTGQRQGDILRLPWSAYDGTHITLRQGKTGRIVSIKCTKALRKMLDGMKRRGPLILQTKTGLAFKKRYFSDQWQEACEAAKITDLHFHDLRGTAVTMLAEAECEVPQIAAVTGHSMKNVDKILELYLSRTKHLADAAIMKLERYMK